MTEEKTPGKFGLFLTAMRLIYSESLSDMAAKLGIETAHLSDIESGAPVPPGLVDKIRAAYDLDEAMAKDLADMAAAACGR